MIDACVLYPTVMREIAIGCAAQGLFEPRWSDRILEEWARAAAKLGPRDEIYARGQVAVLKAQFPTASVPTEEGLMRRLWLPDPDDIHVLAAAVAGSCDTIMTMNAKDFPGNVLAEEGLFRAHPDAFLRGLYEETPSVVKQVAQTVLEEANRMSDKSWDIRALMKKARLPRLGKALAPKF